MATFRVGDVGSVIRVTVVEHGAAFDASLATVKTMKLRKPDGSVIEREATFETDGNDGICKYATVEGDLDQHGPWGAQVYFELPGWKGHTDPFSFNVGENVS